MLSWDLTRDPKYFVQRIFWGRVLGSFLLLQYVLKFICGPSFDQRHNARIPCQPKRDGFVTNDDVNQCESTTSTILRPSLITARGYKLTDSRHCIVFQRSFAGGLKGRGSQAGILPNRLLALWRNIEARRDVKPWERSTHCPHKMTITIPSVQYCCCTHTSVLVCSQVLFLQTWRMHCMVTWRMHCMVFNSAYRATLPNVDTNQER